MKLQPLRIENSWQVNYNQLYEVDPIAGYESYFEGSSLLMLQNNVLLKFIDVQWRPERDLNGEYQLQVLNFLENFNSKTKTFDIDVDWKNPFLTFATISRVKLVDKLEELVRTLPFFEDPRMIKSRGVVDELSESYRLSLLGNGISIELVKEIIDKGSANIQNHTVDHKKITREMLSMFAESGITKKIKKKANQKLNSKRYRE